MVYELKKIEDTESLNFFRKKSEPVTKDDKNLDEIIDNMLNIMYKNDAIGIAAIMIGIYKRLIVVDLRENNRKKPIVMINPEIISMSDEKVEFNEASISLDDVICPIKRSKNIKVKYFDNEFIEHELLASDLLSVCIQHQMDYLEGNLFFDYAPEDKKEKIISFIKSELKIKNIISDIEILREKCKPIKNVTEKVKKELDKMLEIMYAYNGVGLAANQVGLNKRMIVIDLQKDGKKQPIFLINPKILSLSDNFVEMEEGCLSVPGCSAKVKRPDKIKVEYTNKNSEKTIIEADGLLARCLQHEIDHLDGKLYTDYLSKLKRDLIIKKVKNYIS